MFLRDMKTMMKRDVNERRGMNAMLAKAMLLVLLFLEGGMASEAWATLATPARYYIVNNKGSVVFNFNNNTDNLYVHAKARSPLAKNFRFYTTKEDAIADATNGTKTNAVYEVDNPSAASGGTYYVRYDYDDTTTSIADITGSKWYKLHFLRPDNNKICYLRYDGLDTNAKWQATLSETPDFYWKFESDGDPYDIHLINRSGDLANSQYQLTAVNVQTGQSSNNNKSSLQYFTKADYDPSGEPVNVQGFIILQSTESKIEIVAAYNGYLFNSTKSNTDPTAQVHYIAPNDNGTDNGNAECHRVWAGQYGTERVQIELIEAHPYTYHIVNSQNKIAISGTAAPADYASSTTIPMLDELKTPLIDDSQEGAYLFFDTQAKAYAYSSATTASARATAAAEKITTYGEVTSDGNIYVGYYYNPATAPTGSPDLSGNTQYQIKTNGSTNYYLYHTGTYTSANYASSITNSYLWTFTGDPYNLSITNGDDLVAYADLKKIDFSQGWLTDLNLASSAAANTLSSFVILNDGTGNYYHIVAVRGNDNSVGYQFSPGELKYLGFLGHQNTRGRFLRNNTTASFTSDRGGDCSLSFVPIRQTYIVVDASGNTLVSAYKNGNTLELPDIIKSPLVSEYRYYDTQAKAIADDSSTKLTSSPGPLATIYVRYTLAPASEVDLSGSIFYNIKVNDDYVYADGASLASESSDANIGNDTHKWLLNGNDPYQVTIQTDATHQMTYSSPAGSSSALTLSSAGSKFFIRGSLSAGPYELVAVTGQNLDENGSYAIGRTDATIALYNNSIYPMGNSGIKVNIESKKRSVVWHIINTGGSESVRLTSEAPVDAVITTPPSSINSQYAKNWQFFTSTAKSQSLTAIPDGDTTLDIYAYYEYDDTKTLPALDADQYYTMQVGGSKYAYLDGSNVALADSKATTDTYLWTLVNGDSEHPNDPYNIKLYNYNTKAAVLSNQSFVLMNALSSSTCALMAAEGATEKTSATLQYLSQTSGTQAGLSNSFSSGDTESQLLFEDVDVNYTFTIVDLSNNISLKSKSAKAGKGGQIIEIDEALGSPLVEEYYYWASYDSSTGCTGSLNGRLPYTDCTVYVTYKPFDISNAPLKLDGSVNYAIHVNSSDWKLIGKGINTQVQAITTEAPFHVINYQWQLQATHVDGKYDPYDVTFFNPGWYFTNNGGYMYKEEETSANQTNSVVWVNKNAEEASHFMILNGNTGYYEVMRRRSDDQSIYQYMLATGGTLGTGRRDNESDVKHGMEKMQVHFQPAYEYRVVNLSGTLATRAIESRLVTGTTTPSLPTLITSPAVMRYSYYDRSAFNISDDGVYTLNSGASTLEHIAEATTPDIFVVYNRSDVNNSLLDLTGAKSYNITAKTKDANVKTAYLNGSNVAGAVDLSASAEELKTDAYLWQFKANGDPYNIQIFNAGNSSLPITATGTQSSYASGLSTTTAANKYVRTFSLLSSTAGDDYKYKLLANVEVWENSNLLNANWMSTYAAYYLYLGTNTNGDSNASGDSQIAVVGYNNGGQNDSQCFQLKFTRQRDTQITYVVNNRTGVPAVKMTVEGTTGVAPSVPLAIKSPLIADDGWHYWSNSSGTEPIALTTTDAAQTIYVTYDYDPLTSPLYFDGSVEYYVQANGRYLYNNSGLAANNTKESTDSYLWTLSGNDPYQVSLTNKGAAQGLAYASPSANTNTLSLTSSGSTFIIMGSSDAGPYELMAATGTSVDVGTAYYNVGYDSSNGESLFGNGLYKQGHDALRIVFSPNLTSVTYHIINFSGRECLRYTSTDMSKFDLPEQFQSPLATDYKFYYVSQFSISDGVYTLNGGETDQQAMGYSIPEKPHVYVKYEYDATAASTMGIDLSGSTTTGLFGKGPNGTPGPIMLGKSGFWGQRISHGAKNHLHYHPKWYLWRFVGDNNDPYNVQIRIDKGDYLGEPNNTSNGLDNLECWLGGGARSLMLLKGEDGFFEIVYGKTALDGGNLQYMYFNGDYDVDDQGYAFRYSRHISAHRHGDPANQFTVQQPYIYHIITLNGEKAATGIGSLYKVDGVTKPALPEVLVSPLIADGGYEYYDISQFDESQVAEGRYMLKDGQSSKTYLSDFTTHDIYVKYKASSINEDVDLTGKISYNIQVGNDYDNASPYYVRFDSEGTNAGGSNNSKLKGKASPSTEDVYLWKLVGGDPYDIALYNLSDNENPLAYEGASIANGQSDVKSVTLDKSKTYNRVALVGGKDASHYRIMFSKGLEASNVGYPDYIYIGEFRGNKDNPLIASIASAEVKYSAERKQINLTPARNNNHIYVVVDNEGNETLQRKIYSTYGVAPEMPDELKSPLATRYRFFTAADTLTVQPEVPAGENAKIYVRYDLISNPAVDVTGELYYTMQVSDYYAYAQSSASQPVLSENTDANKGQGDHVWQFNGSDPYAITISNLVHEDSRVGAGLSNTLQFYGADNASVLRFALLSGDGTDGHYVMVQAEGKDVVEDNLTYLVRPDAENNLKLLSDDDYTREAAATQVQIEGLKLRYTYYVVDQTDKTTIVGKKTLDEEVPMGSLAEDLFPFWLKRQGTVRTGYAASYYGNETGRDDADVYNNGDPDMRLGLKTSVYVAYAVDESQLTFKYSGGLDDAPTTDPNKIYWHNWYANRNNDNTTQAYVYWNKTNNELGRTNLQAGPSDGDEYLWAYFGDPYRTKIINKYTGQTKFLGSTVELKSNSHSVTLTDATGANVHTTWGYSTHTDQSIYNNVPVESNDGYFFMYDPDKDLFYHHTDKNVDFRYFFGSNHQLNLDAWHDNSTTKGDGTFARNTIMRRGPLYKIVNLDDNVAISGFSRAEFKGLSDVAVPSEILSPAVKGENFTYSFTQDRSTAFDKEYLDHDPYSFEPIYVYYTAKDVKDVLQNGVKLKMNNTKMYNVLVNGKYAQYDGSSVTLQTQSAVQTTNDYLWTIDGLAGGGSVDPYHLTLRNANDTENAHNLKTYILMNGNSDGQYQLMLSSTTLDGSTSNPYQWLDASIGNFTTAAQVQFKGVPVKVTYAVINLSGTQSIHYTADCEGGDDVCIPAAIKSMQVPYESFHYWKPSGVKRGGENYEDPRLDKDFTSAEVTYDLSGASKYDEPLPYSGTPVVYVTYDWTDAERNASSVDLSGKAVFNIQQTIGTTVTTLYNNGTSGTTYIGNQLVADWKEEVAEEDLQKNDYLWRLWNDDPYCIQLTLEKLKDNGYLSAGDPINSDKDYLNVRILSEASFGETSSHPRFAFNAFILLEGDEGYDDCCKLMSAYCAQTSKGMSYWYLGNRSSTSRSGTFHRSNTIGSGDLVNIKLISKNVVQVTYHLTRQVTGEEMVSGPTTRVCKSEIQLPEDWKRKYCNYTYKTYYDASTLTYDAANNPLSEISQIPLVVTDNLDDTPQLDIYVSYDVSGLPFNLIPTEHNTKAEIENLPASVFNLDGYENRLARSFSDTKTDGYIYFLVMNTNDDFTNNGGTQQFLRREDNGRISWMNNGYTLHYNPMLNANKHNYSREADSYCTDEDRRQFHEKRWLWAFAGDPYDLYVFNMNGVTEEVYNDATRTVTMTWHPKYAMGWTTLDQYANGLYKGSERVLDRQNADNTPATATGAIVYRWGLGFPTGDGIEDSGTFSILAGETTQQTTTDSNGRELTSTTQVPGGSDMLYWQMAQSAVVKDNNGAAMNIVQLLNRTTTTKLEQNLRVLPYYPTRYEDVNLVVRRSDNIGFEPSATPNTHTEGNLQPQATGLSRMYFSSATRRFAAGDEVGKDDLPITVLRAFCDYTTYSDVYDTPGKYIVKAGPYKEVKSVSGTDTTWVYKKHGEATEYTTAEAAGWPQNFYVKYEVTSDIFLRNHPTKEQVTQMVQDNDHVYFMDFPNPTILAGKAEAYNTGYHAFFDEEATFKDVVGDLKAFYNNNAVKASDRRTEKRKFNGTDWVDDNIDWANNQEEYHYNLWQFRTATNRMETAPENLKWYFVGDPYKVQVYSTQSDFNTEAVTEYADDDLDNETVIATHNAGTLAAQLCRFNPVESNFRGVVDCVHLRLPDYENRDPRAEVDFYDINGHSTKKQENVNYKRQYFPNFYWEMVPAATTSPVEDGFALRFKADNELLGYRDIYYYLGHNGLNRQYDEGSGKNVTWNVNLNYRTSNVNRDSKGDAFLGYHKANNDTTVIRLRQPVKVYVTTNRTADSRYEAKSNVTVDELSEYYALDETIKEVPRHLQRKYVSYNWTDKVLSDANATSKAECPSQTANPGSGSNTHWVFQTGTKDKYTFKYNVDYQVADLNTGGEHLFTTDLAANAQWLDVQVGAPWMYYDKVNRNEDNSEKTWLVSQYTQKSDVTNNNTTVQGWNTGLKGLHWAFVGDPYEFYIVNRRRCDDKCGDDATNQYQYLGTHYAQHYAKEEVNTYDEYGRLKRDASGEIITDKENKVWYNYTVLTDAPSEQPKAEQLTTARTANKAFQEGTTAVTTGSGNTEWSLMMCKTGGDSDYFIRTATRKTDNVANTDGSGNDGDWNNGSGPGKENVTNHYQRLVAKDFSAEQARDGDEVKERSGFVSVPFYLRTKTSDIAKTIIRTAVAEDNDGAKNDCFDANVTIYNKQTGKKMARMEGVELRYGNVLESLPYNLRRFGCSYPECYQLRGSEYDDTKNLSAYTDKVTLLNLPGTSLEFSKNSLNPDYAHTEECHTYYEIAYTYTVDDDVAQYFTTATEADQDDYTWTNSYYKWDQTYSGTNVRKVEYVDVFDHYEYDANGHIINRVYRQEERVSYESGTFSTPAYGWLNSHTGQELGYADDRSQNEYDRQKWAFVGDPYSFTMKNYAQYIEVDTASVLTVNQDNGIVFSTVGTTHWAIVQGAQKTEVKDKKVQYVWQTDNDGNYALDGNGQKIPVYNYYLALIDDNTGNTLHFVTFDRASKSADLPAESQHLYLLGGPLANDPTGNLFVTKDNEHEVRPFYLTDLLNYAAGVLYHLVITHQHALDYEDTFSNLTTTAEKNEASRIIDQHLVEWLKYQYPEYMEKNTVTTSNGSTYDKTTETIASGYNASGDGTVGNGSSPLKDRLTDAAKTAIQEKLMKTSLRDVVNDGIPDYYVSGGGIGNRVRVPWYMQRQFCTYKLYQRDVLRSEMTDKPAEANDTWIANGGRTQEVTYDGQTYTAMVNDDGSPIYEDKWQSVTEPKKDGSYSSDRDAVLAANGTEITKLDMTHKNRRVIIDVVYDVNPEQFRFADQGRNTTAWYEMMTNNEQDGMMNFSYKDGIGARHDRHVHYTNNYLWAPEGDPYGFVLHSRYATINGTGWDNVVVTTMGLLPTDDISTTVTLLEKTGTKDAKGNDVYQEVSGENTTDHATYTGAAAGGRFINKRIVHFPRGYSRADGSTVQTNGARNAVYEMFAGDFDKSFIMHPTSAYIDITGDDFSSYYMVHNATDRTAELQYFSNATTIRSNADANWQLVTTPSQLLPYFWRSGYVGGLKPNIAGNFTNIAIRNALSRDSIAIANGSMKLSDLEFTTYDAARKLVYEGDFYARKTNGTYETTAYTYDQPRPSSTSGTGADTDQRYKLPLKFVSKNLVPMERGYYRIEAFSRQALDHDAKHVNGIEGPRFISGYRFKSALDYKGYATSAANGDEPQAGSRWLHFIETDEAHTKDELNTFGELNDHIANHPAYANRTITEHPSMRGNIDILPAEYDPASIFHFTPVSNELYDRYNVETQGLRLRGRAGGVESGNAYDGKIEQDANKYGVTKMVDASAGDYHNGRYADEDNQATDGGHGIFDDRFRLQDIGGAAVTLRLLDQEPAGNDWDNIVGENLKHGSLCIDGNHRYRVTIHRNNEMMEIGDDYTEWSGDEDPTQHVYTGIQDTKWLLKPVGVQTQWPYNEMPLSLEVHEGDKVKKNDDTDDQRYYYASLFVPFDSRLSNTTDIAFSAFSQPNISTTPSVQSTWRLASVSQKNNMGNPQYIPAAWPVVVRTSKPITTGGTRPHVNLYLPYNEPQTLSYSGVGGVLTGKYLEQELADEGLTQHPGGGADATTQLTAGNKINAASTATRVMVFGVPFKEDGSNADKSSAATWYDHNLDDDFGFYVNANWKRGHTDYSSSTENDNTMATAHWATSHDSGNTATFDQRDNRYVLHNKVYWIYNPGSASGSARFIRVLFDDEEEENPEDQPIEDDVTQSNVPWPCDVFDMAGRRVAQHETPATLRRNHPNLSPGIYIFGGRKVVVK